MTPAEWGQSAGTKRSTPVKPDPAEAPAMKMEPGPVLEPKQPGANCACAPILLLTSTDPPGTMVLKLVNKLLPAGKREDHGPYHLSQKVLHLLFER